MGSAHSTVEYRDIQGFPGYRIGSDGSVWSCHIVGGDSSKPKRQVRTGQWKKLKCGLQYQGYYRVVLSTAAGRCYKLVHRLLLETFVGPCPVGMEACHKDGVRTNNSLSNLRWDTRKENVADAVIGKRHAHGEKHGSSKLTEAIVVSILNRINNGERTRHIAKDVGVTHTTISAIKSGRLWKHVKRN